MTTTVLVGGSVITGAGERAEWVLLDGSRIAGAGSGHPPTADRTLDLAGATLLPAFCDAHVHLPATGLYAQGMDFRGEHRADAILSAFTQRSRRPGALLFGGNFEDPLDRPVTADDLDRAVGHRPALLARADMHSCIVSGGLLEELELEGMKGVERAEDGRPTGYLREQSAAAAWTWFDANLTPDQTRAALHGAAQLAYSKGVASVHEMYVAEWRGWSALDLLIEALADMALDVVIYVASADVERVRSMGFERIGGDWFLDGSFGSHTAWLSQPYRSTPPSGVPATGISYREDDEVMEFFSRAQTAGMQAGVHAIGDAAIDQAITAWENVATDAGADAVRGLGHRIEHFECARDDHIDRCRRLGLGISVQPAFDRFWGGPDGMYAERIGEERAAEMNRFRSMKQSGLLLGAGSDSTVTPLDPWLQIASLCAHHDEAESLSFEDAFRIHTLGSHALARRDGDAGSIEAGKRADLVAVDRDPSEAGPEDLLSVEVVGTWVEGRRVWPQSDAEAS